MSDILAASQRLKDLSRDLEALAQQHPELEATGRLTKVVEESKAIAEALSSNDGESEAIDWYAIPQIQADLKRLQQHRDGTIETEVNVGEMFYKPDHEYLLRVRVTDVDLAQVTLTRTFSSYQRIPGLDIREVIFDPEADARNKVALKLQDIAHDLINQSNDPSQ